MDARLQGTYKLAGFDAAIDGGDWNSLFGVQPLGHAVITPTRFIAVLTAQGRKPGRAVEERAALFDSLCAYSGRYRLEGDKLITAVDTSWNEVWNGTDQARTWSLEGKRLSLVTDPAPSPFNPNQTAVFRVVWDQQERG